MDGSKLAALIDHTLLAPEATASDVRDLCAEGLQLGVAAVCVSSIWTTVAVEALAGSGLAVATVIGFPSGAHPSAVKAAEAAVAVHDGAVELDMVMPLGPALDGDWATVEADVLAVRAAAGEAVLKVIIESAVLDVAGIQAACNVAEAAGADFVKTSTGFHPAGGATIEAVETMAGAVGGRLGVKASGGIRDRATAEAMVAAGATRIGASRSADIVAG